MRKLLTLVAFVLMLAGQALAQNSRTVTGIVTDETGTPLQGVTVSLPGTKTGTVTNTKGQFTLQAQATSKSVKISFIGYEAQVVDISKVSEITVSIKPDNKSLSEVVVVGYGTQKRGEVTGSIGTVKGAAIAEQPVQSFEGALGGRAAGVQITVPNGIVNNPPVFRIRGTNSLSLSSYPLIVVDGVVTFTGDIGSTSAPTNPLASINPSDIESIDIAKDAAATAIYGSRAANGVVFITTKKGKQGKTRITYDGWVGETQAQRLPKLLNTDQYMADKTEAVANATADGQNLGITFKTNLDKNGKVINTNWLDQVYRKAVSHNHVLSISGANDKTTYYMSAGFSDQQGILKRNEFVRKNLLFNIDQKVGRILTVGGKLSFSNERNLAANSSGSLEGEAFNSGGLARLAFVTAPTVEAVLNDGTYNVAADGTIGRMNNIGVNAGFYNPKVILDLDRSNSIVSHIQSNVYGQLKPFSWLTLRTQYGIDQAHIDNETYSNPLSGDASPTAEAISATGIRNRWVWDNTIQLDYTFAKKHSFSLLAGTEEEKNSTELFGIDRTGQSDPFFTNVEGGWTTTNPIAAPVNTYNYLVSEFGRLNYNYEEKYFLSGNLRHDGNSNLGENNRYGNFYGVSAGWEVAKENFWLNSHLGKIFSAFKLRGGYGKVGNIGGLADYQAMSFYGSSLYGGNPSLNFSQAGNPDLRWETSKQTNVGLTFGLLNDRIHGDVNWYRNNVDGLILFLTQTPSSGIPTTIPKNVGSLYNTGAEVTLGATIIQHKDFTWNSNFNISFLKNKITSLSEGQTQIVQQTAGLESVTVQKVGDPIGMLYVTRTGGVDPQTGRRIFIAKDGTAKYYSKYGNLTGNTWQTADGKATTSVSGNDASAYKKTVPSYYGGWDNTFRYKAFELNALITFQGGNYVYYGSNAGLRDQRFWNNNTSVLHRWQKAGDKTDVPRVVYGDNVSNGSSFPLDVNVFKGDYLKLRSITLAYYMPSSLTNTLHLGAVKAYVSGNNLAIKTKYPGPDPEVSSNGNNAGLQGIDRNTLANGRTLTFGLNVNF